MPITRNRFRAALLGVPVLAAVAIAGCGGTSTAKPVAHAAVQTPVVAPAPPTKRAPIHPARRHPHHAHRPVQVTAPTPTPPAPTQPAPAPAQGSAPAPAPVPPPSTSGGIPQRNGGDMDGDNNGGPSDGDGGV